MIKTDNVNAVFFELLRAGLWEGSKRCRFELLEFSNPIDWDDVYRLAIEQSVLGLMLAGIGSLPTEQRPPKPVLLKWIGEIQVLEQQNKVMNAFIAELVDRMRREGIYTLLVKGQGVAQCYERPQWRSCGDVDFLLNDDNYVKAKAFLTPLASKVEHEGSHSKHLGMTIDHWVVELHGSMRCGLSKKIDREMDKIRDVLFCERDVRSWMNDRTQVFLPGINNDIIYVFIHFLNHFYKEGVGLRQICDWCRLLWTYRDKIDIQLLERRLTAMDLIMAWKAFGALAVEYLGMPEDAMPFYDSRFTKKGSMIMDFVMEVGNMGHNRDLSRYAKYPYLIRKMYSFGRRCRDLMNHARVFPLDSLRFFPNIVLNGLRAAARGEG